MSEIAKKLSPKQTRAVVALVAGRTQQQAANEAGVVESTITRWKQQEHFIAALQDAQAQVIGDVITEMTGGVVDAVRALRGIVNDPDVQPSTRVVAAKAMISEYRFLKDFSELAPAIERMHRALLKGA